MPQTVRKYWADWVALPQTNTTASMAIDRERVDGAVVIDQPDQVAQGGGARLVIGLVVGSVVRGRAGEGHRKLRSSLRCEWLTARVATRVQIEQYLPSVLGTVHILPSQNEQ